MLKIGLTGGIGSGKSTVAEMFANLGITIIDADQISHQLMQSGSEAFNEIKQLFGEEYINSNGEFDRKKMAPIIFSDPSKKNAIEHILHPKIKQQILNKIKEIKPCNYIILVIPLLFESNFTDLVDRVIVVDTDDEIRIKRTHQRDGRTEEQIKNIINMQIDRKNRLHLADDIINNNGDLNHLHEAVTQLHSRYNTITTKS